MNDIERITNGLEEQFAAALVMLENVVIKCDEKIWNDASKGVVIGQIVYHISYFIDEHFCKSENEINTFKPGYGNFQQGEYINGTNWDQSITKDGILNYLQFLRKRIIKRFEELDLESLLAKPLFDWHGSSFLSSFLYDLRHIMLHIGSLHVRLNPSLPDPLEWVSTAKL